MSEHLAQITTRPFTQNPVPAAPKVAPKVPSRPAPKPFTKGPTMRPPKSTTPKSTTTNLLEKRLEQLKTKPNFDPNNPEVKRIERRLKPVHAFIRELVIAADNPNDDPQNLTKQIMPLLQKLRINTIIDGNKTELFIGQMKKMGINNMSLYKVMFRRTANIDDQIIDRLKRSPNFESLDWSENGIVISLWWEYQTGAQ